MSQEVTEGLYVEVYRNLHNKCWSVRHKGIVIWRTSRVTLKNAQLVVQPAGNAKVRREGRKNVHAVVRGYITWDAFPLELMVKFYKVTYDPYQHESFVYWYDHSPVHKANMVLLDIDQGVYVSHK